MEGNPGRDVFDIVVSFGEERVIDGIEFDDINGG